MAMGGYGDYGGSIGAMWGLWGLWGVYVGSMGVYGGYGDYGGSLGSMGSMGAMGTRSSGPAVPAEVPQEGAGIHQSAAGVGDQPEDQPHRVGLRGSGGFGGCSCRGSRGWAGTEGGLQLQGGCGADGKRCRPGPDPHLLLLPALWGSAPTHSIAWSHGDGVVMGSGWPYGTGMAMGMGGLWGRGGHMGQGWEWGGYGDGVTMGTGWL